MIVNDSYRTKSTEYFQLKGASVDEDGFVSFKDVANILKIGETTISRYFVPPACMFRDRIYKFDIRCIPWLASTCMNRNVKRPELREALPEYFNFIGMHYVDIFGKTLFYVAIHTESNKVKIGITDTHIRERISQVDRYMEGKVEMLLLIDSLGDESFELEDNAKTRFAHLRTEPPDNPFAIGKDEWFTYDDNIKAFVEEHTELNVKDKPEHSFTNKRRKTSSHKEEMDRMRREAAALRAELEKLQKEQGLA